MLSGSYLHTQDYYDSQNYHDQQDYSNNFYSQIDLQDVRQNLHQDFHVGRTQL
jgi:hypothetical protein